MLLRVRPRAGRRLARKPAGGPKRRLLLPLRKLGRRVVAWASACADYRTAAAMYEQLNRLSDAELARRGLSRKTLAHHVLTALDRKADRRPGK
jgi:hypothetical protein